MTIKVNATFNKSKDTGYEVEINIEDLVDAIIEAGNLDDLAAAIDAELNP